jgi:hypothetical protein
MFTDRRNSSRNNSPYVLDALGVRIHRSAAGSLWRWRTETTILATTGSGSGWLEATRGPVLAGTIPAAIIGTLLIIPATRRYLTRRAWCVISRHRLQRVCWETRMHTRSGRIPLVMRIRPTEVGERAWLICRAGVCAEDFNDNADEIRTACMAREARVTRSPRSSQVVIIDIIRRDTLAAHRQVRPHILTRHPQPDPIPAEPAPADSDLMQKEAVPS